MARFSFNFSISSESLVDNARLSFPVAWCKDEQESGDGSKFGLMYQNF
jgi:hypothetical protein